MLNIQVGVNTHTVHSPLSASLIAVRRKYREEEVRGDGSEWVHLAIHGYCLRCERAVGGTMHFANQGVF